MSFEFQENTVGADLRVRPKPEPTRGFAMPETGQKRIGEIQSIEFKMKNDSDPDVPIRVEIPKNDA
jgi:hypothetical protein